MEKEARKELQTSREVVMAWLAKLGGADLQRMNVNSTAQIPQLLFGPSKFFVVNRKNNRHVVDCGFESDYEH